MQTIWTYDGAMSPLPSPASPRARFGIRFALVARRWRQTLDAQLAAAGLTDATWVPLVHLHESGDGITQKALAARINLDGSSLVRLLDILCRQGLVERRIDPADARARRVHLTAAGRSRVQAIRRTLLKQEAVMLEGIPDGDLETMLGHPGRIDARLRALHGNTDDPETAATRGKAR